MERECPPNPNWSLFFVCLLGGLLLVGGGAGIALADGEYDLTVPNAVETPPRTVENPFNDDITDEIDAFAVIEPGESIEVKVTAPEGTAFDIDLLNSNGQRETSTRNGTGSETVTVTDTDGVPPGTYSLVLHADSDYQAFHPVVVSGYDIDFSRPNEAEIGETAEFDDISVTPTELSGDPAGVEVVVWNNDRTERVDASGSDGSYSASIDLDGFESGTYNVHVAALGEDEFRGKPEVLGLSERRTIKVVESDDGGDSDPDSGGDDTGGAPSGGGGGGGGGGVAVPSEPTDGNEPDAQTPSEPTRTVELLDEAPDDPGVRVSFENATARSVTLSNDSASGTVTVTDRTAPPTDSSPPAGSPVAVVEITVPESERDAPATIELAVDAASVNDPANLTVEKYHAEDDTWTVLETTVVETTETTVTLTAETPGFSVFAVTEAASESESEDPATGENGTDSSSSGANDTDESTSSGGDGDGDVITPSESDGEPSNPEDQPGFGLLAAAIAFLLAAGRYSFRRGFGPE